VLLEVRARFASARLSPARGLDYRPPMESPGRPEDLVGRQVPDLTLTNSHGAPFALRSRIGRGPLVLFFYIRNGTPG
jgi:hypothetical protein